MRILPEMAGHGFSRGYKNVMKWSWKIGEYAGIGVYIHATFLLIIGYFALTHWKSGGVGAALSGVLFILVLFVCIVLHEFGHALTARRYGIATRDITLLPIGGVARLERMPDAPWQELWVALAGPAVNVVISLTLTTWLVLTGQWGTLNQVAFDQLTFRSFLPVLMAVNLILAGFNMLPAFPMDGGRVLRALLAMRMDYLRATQVASRLGQGMAFLFGLIGLYSWNPFLLFVALFVWMGAQQEASLVGMRSALAGIQVSHSMVTKFRTLSPYDSLGQAVDEILAGSQQDFPVVENDRVVGVLTRADLLVALAKQGLSASVFSVMRRDFQMVEATEMLELAFVRLQQCKCRTMPVVQNGRLSGLLTMENVAEFIRIHSALKRGNREFKSSVFKS